MDELPTITLGPANCPEWTKAMAAANAIIAARRAGWAFAWETPKDTRVAQLVKLGSMLNGPKLKFFNVPGPAVPGEGLRSE